MVTSDKKGREYDERPWGTYTVLDDECSDHKIKRIIVTPPSAIYRRSPGVQAGFSRRHPRRLALESCLVSRAAYRPNARR